MRYNVDYARSVSKADWMELHKEDAAEVDLSAEYDKMVPPKGKEAKAEPSGKKSAQSEYMSQRGADPDSGDMPR